MSSENEPELLADQEFFFNHAPSGFHTQDAAGMVTAVNDRLLNWLGYSKLEMVGKCRYADLVTGRMRSVFEEHFENLKSTGTPCSIDLELKTRSGTEIPVRLSGYSITKADGGFSRACFVTENLVEHRLQSEAALREGEAHLNVIVASAMDAIITVNSRQEIILFNASASKMFGYELSDVLGKHISLLIPQRFRDSHHHHIARFGMTRDTKRSMGSLGAVHGVRANGEEFPVEASISQVEADGEKYYTVILRDITERKQSEARLSEQAELLDQAQDAIVVRDLEDRILYWNRGAERLYGWKAEESLGKTATEMAFRQSQVQYQQAMAEVLDKGEWHGEMRQLTKTGKDVVTACRWTLVCDEAGKPKSILAINTDLTEQKRLEMQFLRAQRLESIGTLAGGIAHDLNNVLSPLMMAAQMLQLKFTDPDSQRWLKVMLTNIERGTEMVKQILLFARGSQGERIVLQPKHLVKEIVKIVKETFPKNIEIVFNIPEEPWQILGDATQLHQVLINLCVNARDAMPEGGKLTIEIENHVFDANYSRINPQATPGPYIVVIVSDTGVGIPQEVINRIFDPFFTTKEHGKGTGLGLATVQGIVKGHKGFVNVYSEPGKGTKFTVYLPAAASTGMAEAEVAKPQTGNGKGETVLVVDDEPAIREVLDATLRAFGYNVLTAADGVEAVAAFAAHKSEVKVVITDMMMPVMDGPATIRALRKLSPDIPIIACSGLAEESKTQEAYSAGAKAFLPKPFTKEKLLDTLLEVLRA